MWPACVQAGRHLALAEGLLDVAVTNSYRKRTVCSIL